MSDSHCSHVNSRDNLINQSKQNSEMNGTWISHRTSGSIPWVKLWMARTALHSLPRMHSVRSTSVSYCKKEHTIRPGTWISPLISHSLISHSLSPLTVVYQFSYDGWEGLWLNSQQSNINYLVGPWWNPLKSKGVTVPASNKRKTWKRNVDYTWAWIFEWNSKI